MLITYPVRIALPQIVLQMRNHLQVPISSFVLLQMGLPVLKRIKPVFTLRPPRNITNAQIPHVPRRQIPLLQKMVIVLVEQ